MPMGRREDHVTAGMNVGEVWILRCVGISVYGLVLKCNDDGGFNFLDLETGDVRRWHNPEHIGFQVGAWTRFA